MAQGKSSSNPGNLPTNWAVHEAVRLQGFLVVLKQMRPTPVQGSGFCLNRSRPLTRNHTQSWTIGHIALPRKVWEL